MNSGRVCVWVEVITVKFMNSNRLVFRAVLRISSRSPWHAFWWVWVLVASLSASCLIFSLPWYYQWMGDKNNSCIKLLLEWADLRIWLGSSVWRVTRAQWKSGWKIYGRIGRKNANFSLKQCVVGVEWKKKHSLAKSSCLQQYFF